MELVKENKYYVYALIDPINRLPFYIGKGCGNRAWSHLKNEKTNVGKVRTIEWKFHTKNHRLFFQIWSKKDITIL